MEALGSVDSSSTSLETHYDVIESSASEKENQDTHVHAQVISLLSKLRAPSLCDLVAQVKKSQQLWKIAIGAKNRNKPATQWKTQSRAAAAESGLKIIKPEKRVAGIASYCVVNCVLCSVAIFERICKIGA